MLPVRHRQPLGTCQQALGSLESASQGAQSFHTRAAHPRSYTIDLTAHRATLNSLSSLANLEVSGLGQENGNVSFGSNLREALTD